MKGIWRLFRDNVLGLSLAVSIAALVLVVIQLWQVDRTFSTNTVQSVVGTYQSAKMNYLEAGLLELIEDDPKKKALRAGMKSHYYKAYADTTGFICGRYKEGGLGGRAKEIIQIINDDLQVIADAIEKDNPTLATEIRSFCTE